MPTAELDSRNRKWAPDGESSRSVYFPRRRLSLNQVDAQAKVTQGSLSPLRMSSCHLRPPGQVFQFILLTIWADLRFTGGARLFLRLYLSDVQPRGVIGDLAMAAIDCGTSLKLYFPCSLILISISHAN